ncbi:hypothetical protein N7540_012433 [Penicillium herquei]|nr:hypothetical protein N7540_012433 [Penicillium herquei]
MPKTLRLLREEITYSKAQREEVDILLRLQYYERQQAFFTSLSGNPESIKAVVAHHLGLSSTNQCQVADVEDWLHGSFNVCIPVTIENWKARSQPGSRVLVRLPLPHRLGEEFRPGNCDEKIRCEAGTYAWIEENCPDVPIPRFYGFATSDGVTLTHIDELPLINRFFQYSHRLLRSYLGYQLPSSYIPCHPPNSKHIKEHGALNTGYILIELIEKTKGQMRSSTWLERRDNSEYRQTLFRDLSRVLLSLTRISLPAIGSFVVEKDEYLRLKNRPLSVEIQALENDHIPTDMPRDYTYSTVESYIVDLLRMHNNRVRHQPNEINNLSDYINQTAALATMQTTFPSFFTRDLCRGPFAFTLTDLHPSNIFVDDNWHIASIVDLEWTCSRPIEMIRTPTWLTTKAMDEITEEAVEYDAARFEFLQSMANEEKALGIYSRKEDRIPISLSEIMNRGWQSGAFWFSLALSSPMGLFSVFYKQIQPRFIKHCPDQEAFHEIVPWYWSQDYVNVAAAKRKDHSGYDARLKAALGL